MTPSRKEQDHQADGETDEATELEDIQTTLNHIGHTVPDIEAAVEWYSDVLGFTVVAPPASVPAGSGHFADLFADIVGDFDEAKVAHLVTPDGIGFELFEYQRSGTENARARDDDENWQEPPGIHHFAIQHPDVEGLASRIVEHGGTRHSEVWFPDPDQDYRLVYMKDPWDNFIEIYSHSYTQFFANQG